MDRYGIESSPIRNLLIDYLAERQPVFGAGRDPARSGHEPIAFVTSEGDWSLSEAQGCRISEVQPGTRDLLFAEVEPPAVLTSN